MASRDTVPEKSGAGPNRRLLLGMTLAAGGGIVLSACGARDRALADVPGVLANPYRPHVRPGPRFTCETAPAPVVDLAVSSPYKGGNYAARDEQAFARTRGQIKDVATFASVMSDSADGALFSPDAGQRSAAAACMDRAIVPWAEAGALLGNVNRQAGYERTKVQGATALALLKAQAGAGYAPPPAVRKWIDALSAQLGANYRADKQNNQYYWAALAACASSVVVNDKGLFQWSSNIFDTALAAITPDGYLPLELERGEGALAYHVYSLAPLITQAFVLRANGRTMGSLGLVRGGGLQRLVSATLDGLDNPGLFTARSGVAQSADRSKWDDANMAWLPIYLAMVPDQKAALWAQKLKAPRSVWLGGLV